MTEKELKHLNRKELVELLLELKKRNADMQGRLTRMEEQLADKTIRIENSGSIAEAALSLNHVFEAAQEAADSYLHSVHLSQEEIEARNTELRERESKILQDAECQATKRLQDAERICSDMLADAEAQIQQKWRDFKKNVDEVLRKHDELSSYLKQTNFNQERN